MDYRGGFVFQKERGMVSVLLTAFYSLNGFFTFCYFPNLGFAEYALTS